MNKSVMGIVVALLAIGGIAALVMTSNNNEPVASTQDSGPSTNQTNQVASSNTEADTTSPSNATETAGDTEVTIQNFAFAPKSIKVKVGSKVTWTNQDSTNHDVMPDNETDEFKASELLDKGESYSVTFNTPGTYSYFCSPHPYMKASVEVVE